MEKKKLTRKDYYNILFDIVTKENREDLVEFVAHELDLLNHTSLTKTQKKNLELVEKLYSDLAQLDKPVTIKEIQDNFEDFRSLQNQKISALLIKLVDTNRVVRVVNKNKSYFSIAD